jgi:RNA polymerase sigma-70 factor (ECF subfamily)
LRYSNIEDALQAFKGNKNNVAFKYLYDALSKKVYYICLRYMSSTAEAQDQLQDIFIKLFEKINEYNNQGSFEGWVKRIATNSCLQKIRDTKMQFFAIENIEVFENIDEEVTDEEALNAKENELMNCLQSLPHHYKTIINMAIIDDYSHKQIAAFFGITENSSRIQLMRAKNLLTSKMQKNGQA